MKEKNFSALRCNMDIFISGLEEFVPFEFKNNSHSFNRMKFWKNL